MILYYSYFSCQLVHCFNSNKNDNNNNKTAIFFIKSHGTKKTEKLHE